jgi:predicted transposase YbfD/YdcC
LFVILSKAKNLSQILRFAQNDKTILLKCPITYFITNQCFAAEKMLNAVRLHWGIENELYWCLDVCFNEGNHRNKVDDSAINFSFLRELP